MIMKSTFKEFHDSRLTIQHSNLVPASSRARSFASKSDNKDDEESLFEKPAKFLGSKAHTMKSGTGTLFAAEEKSALKRPPPKAQWYAIYWSFVSAIVYFLYLRQENDIDYHLQNTSLYDQVEGLELADLKGKVLVMRKYGQNTTEIEKRITELEAEMN